ncbi:MAG: L-lactate permease [Chloroflexi bacterium]|nr:L-lactate permease [Chloroflexota bacterium]MBV9898494.1 L-lactate permease [Chloroflexota bacterium]
MYLQNYNPTGIGLLSTLLAAVPILTLLYLVALHPHRDQAGRRHLGISAPWAAFGGVIASFVIALLVVRMPAGAALSAFIAGALNGAIGIVWIIVGAMLLYTITLVSGKFEIVKESITHISFDRRLQCLLIAFSFGAIIEGTSGFGTPVAIAGAMMVGLGFAPFQSAVLNLLANTAPVAWGAIGSPIVGLSQSSGLPALDLSTMAGRQLPWASIVVPFWLVAVFVKMEGGRWADVFEVWPATLVAGGVFALVQWSVSSLSATYLLTDVLAGLISVLAVVLFLRVWHPRTRFLLRRERNQVAGGLGAVGPGAMAAQTGAAAEIYRYPYSLTQTLEAWVPWAILIACVAIWGLNAGTFNDALPVPGRQNAATPVTLGSPLGVTVEAASYTRLLFDMPGADKQVQRTPPVAPANATPERVQFTFNWLSAPGTATVLAAILSGLFLRLSAAQWGEALVRTARRLRVPVLVICQVLGLASLTRYAGTDAILGLAFTVTGPLYPFFAAYLGWLGVFLTGSDTASNALFGSLQRITAEQLHLNPILAAATNSTGGVMGKMIDAQSITVATAACYENAAEGSNALGPIFRRVFWFSVAGAAFIGLVALIQAYLFPGVIPLPPG